MPSSMGAAAVLERPTLAPLVVVLIGCLRRHDRLAARFRGHSKQTIQFGRREVVFRGSMDLSKEYQYHA